MQYFLKEAAKYFLSEFSGETADTAVIFPGKRSILYFNKYLSEISDKPVWAPACFTITTLMEQLSGYKATEKLTLVFELFEAYKKTTNSTEKIDEFFYYAEMLLSDFDDIDKYLVNPKDIFQNLSDLKNLENQFDYLEEEQVKIIRRFWDSFRHGIDSRDKKSFITLWDAMPMIYNQFKATLVEKGIAYEGMIYRKVADQITEGTQTLPDYKKFIFIGFNALNKSEDKLFSYLNKMGKAEFLWDYDTSYLNNIIHEAGYFIRENIKKYPPPEIDVQYENLTGKDKNITIFNISSNSGQTSAIPLFLGNIAKSESDNFENTAVILANESLLLPALASVPEYIEDINVTMGFPFVHSSLYNLLYCIINLHKSSKHDNENEYRFYYKDVIALLNTPEVSQNGKTEIMELKRSIIKANKIYPCANEITVNQLIKVILNFPKNSRQIPGYFLDILTELGKTFRNEDNKGFNQNSDAEFLYLAILTFKRLKELIENVDAELSFQIVFSIIIRSLSGLTVPFSGEPLKGLQVMGILETRVLDFENIIILSMNEGIFPKSGNPPTFIPLSLRYGFGLPVPEHRDAIYAYYFYRLMQRAGNITLVYNSKHDGMTTGERSRFIHQLYYDPFFNVEEKTIISDVTFKLPKKIRIEKDRKISEILEKYTNPESKNSLTPSAINTYLNCSLRFYFRYIEGLKETELVTEELDPAMFGSVLHKAMELLYRQHIGKVLTSGKIEEIIKNETGISVALEQAFKEEFFGNQKVEIRGKNRILEEILRKYIHRILEYDKSYAPFMVLSLEQSFSITLTLNNGVNVKIGGIIDRIDEKEGRTRVIDYKTGEMKNRFDNIESLFNHAGSKRNNAVFQTLLYCLVLRISENMNNIIPGLYFIKSIFKENFDYRILQQEGRSIAVPVENSEVFLHEFENRLKDTLLQVFDPNTPFDQTNDLDVCKNCPYNSICHRE